MGFLHRPVSEPPIEDLPDEPVLFRTGPHWVANDITLGLAAITAVAWLYAGLLDPTFVRFAAIPTVPFVMRLAVDIPRYWHFGVVLTTRRLVIDVGIVRDVYHRLRVAHIRQVTLSQNTLGQLLGFGDVEVTLDAVDGEGQRHHGTYLMAYVRRPRELADAIREAAIRAGGISQGGEGEMSGDVYPAVSPSSKSSEAEFTQ